MICSHTSLCHRNLQLLWKNALQQELLKISHLLLSFATFCSFRLDYHVHFILPPSIFPSLIVQIYLCLRFLLWRAAIHGVAKSRTRLIDWTELNWRFLMKSPKTRLGSFLAIIEDPVFTSLLAFVGLPRWLKGLIKKKKIHLQFRSCRRHGFDHWVGKIPWRRARKSTGYSCPENPVDRGAWRVLSP